MPGSSPLKNGSASCGGVFTDNTWPIESNTAKKDTTKTSSNRYTKNQYESGITERYLDYKFELENDKYDVYVCCVDPWGVSKSPNVYVNYGKESQETLKEGLNASAQEVVKKTIDVTDGELTVNLRGTGDNNKAINVAYIMIRKYKELTPEEIEAEKKSRVEKDCAALNYSGKEELYTVKYEIPAKAVAAAVSYDLVNETTGETETRDVIRISFSGAEGEVSPMLHTSAYTSTNYDNNAGITAMVSDVGTVQKTGDNSYRLEVPDSTAQVKIKTELADKYGLLYMDGVLVDGTKEKKITLENTETAIAIQVYAEDHETKADYQLTIAKIAKKPEIVRVKSLTVSPTAKFMSVGETLQLKTTVAPANAANKAVTFKSSNTAVATVTTSGKVTAKKKETAVITVISKSNTKVKAKCKIIVK